MIERWDPKDKSSLNILYPILQQRVTLKPLCNMKCHCSCIIFKSSYVIYFLLIQIVDLKYELERVWHGDVLRAPVFQGSQCAGQCFAIWSQCLAVSALFTIFSCSNIQCIWGGSICDYSYCIFFFFFLSLFQRSLGPAWSKPTFLFSHTFFADQSLSTEWNTTKVSVGKR